MSIGKTTRTRDNREYTKWMEQETQVAISQNSNKIRKETCLKRSRFLFYSLGKMVHGGISPLRLSLLQNTQHFHRHSHLSPINGYKRPAVPQEQEALHTLHTERNLKITPSWKHCTELLCGEPLTRGSEKACRGGAGWNCPFLEQI